jgi:two-component system, OmpR family, response regulator RstA
MSSATIAKVLLIENDDALARSVSSWLLRNGLDVAVAEDSGAVLERVKVDIPDLVILDTESTNGESAAHCRELRKVYSHPILVLAGEGDLEVEIRVLESGADDCLPKPVNPKLLLARINSLLRRFQGIERNGSALKIGSMLVDMKRRTALLQEQTLDLTTSEFDLLWLLVSHAGEVLTRDQISHNLRGYEWNGAERSIDLGISRLRRKLGDDGRRPNRIKSVRGTGYMWVAE